MLNTNMKHKEEIIMTMIKTRWYYEVCDCEGTIFDYFNNEDDAIECADKTFDNNKDNTDPDYCVHVYLIEEWFDEVDSRWRRDTEDIIHTAIKED